MKTIVSLALIGLFSAAGWASEKDQPPKAAQSIPELQQQLAKILKDNYVPGVSVAIARREGLEWAGGVGLADVSSKTAVTADTQFRIGSTSKAFASLSILKLANEGKLSLTDPVRKLAPEVWFENPWEKTNPVLVVDLLEHTTGWDDMHLREYAKDGPPSMGLRQALDYDHTSRVSRWPPGTRMAYCNSGPAVAAYIVEKITGQRFEDYVEANFFRPIGMKSASYFRTEAPAATLYHGDGKTPYPYWNIIYRPAGSINASANDMAAYLAFYLNHGTVNGVEVIPEVSLERMQNPTRTWAAQEGLKAGYGMSNYWSINNGFVYHGHDGGVAGGLTELAYMPEHGVGYFYSINSGNGGAFEKIGKTIRAYITKGLTNPALPPQAELPTDADSYSGWYEPNSPRMQLFYFLERPLGMTHVHFADGKMLVRPLVTMKEDVFLPVEGRQFRKVPQKDAPYPVATVMLLTPNVEGRYMQVASGMVTWKRVPGWWAATKIVLIGYSVLAILSVVLYAPFWLLGGISKRRRRPQERAMRCWPLVAVLSLVGSVVLILLSADDIITRMGNLTLWSAGVFALTILFAVASVFSVLAVWRGHGARKWVKRYSVAIAVALLITTLYFVSWDVIGLRTWA